MRQRRCFGAFLAGLAGLGISACGDDALHADWSQLPFPEGVSVTEPIEKPSGITDAFGWSAIAVGPRSVNSQELTRIMRLHLADEGWEISGRNHVPPGFFADAPESIDVASIEPIAALKRDPRWVRQELRQRIKATPDASRGVVVRLAPTEQQPG